MYIIKRPNMLPKVDAQKRKSVTLVFLPIILVVLVTSPALLVYLHIPYLLIANMLVFFILHLQSMIFANAT